MDLQSVLKDTRGALEDFTSAANLSPHTAHIYYNRGNLHASLEHWPEALLDFTQGNYFVLWNSPSKL